MANNLNNASRSERCHPTVCQYESVFLAPRCRNGSLATAHPALHLRPGEYKMCLRVLVCFYILKITEDVSEQHIEEVQFG